MNLQHAHKLARIDRVCESGKIVEVETQYGEIGVHPIKAGYIAEYFFNGIKYLESDKVASVAFMKLADLVKSLNEYEVDYASEAVQ